MWHFGKGNSVVRHLVRIVAMLIVLPDISADSFAFSKRVVHSHVVARSMLRGKFGAREGAVTTLSSYSSQASPFSIMLQRIESGKQENNFWAEATFVPGERGQFACPFM